MRFSRSSHASSHRTRASVLKISESRRKYQPRSDSSAFRFRKGPSEHQYLGHVADLLDAAAHVPAWAVAYTDDGFLPTEELVETIRRLRRVGTVYTKDFTELTGARAVIITA